jgi:hypothetical protein
MASSAIRQRSTSAGMPRCAAAAQQPVPLVGLPRGAQLALAPLAIAKVQQIARDADCVWPARDQFNC